MVKLNSNTTMHAIEVNNIVKKYPGKKESVVALDTISFTVEEGEIFGLIGPDGAGKTTLFRILTTLLLADSGSAVVCGNEVVKDMLQIRKISGYMPGRFSLYPDLSVEENLEFFASIFETTIEENYSLVEDIYRQLEPFKKRRAGKLSGGMKQKLALCCALIHKPRILFLDEPTTGVDPVSRKEFWEMLKRLKTAGITIIVSTPYMDEAKLCNRIALMNKGKILLIDKPESVAKSFGKKLFAVKAANMFTLLQELRNYQKTATCFAFGDKHHLTLTSDDNAETEIRSYLDGAGFKDYILHEIEPGIEDCFMQLMGNTYEQ